MQTFAGLESARHTGPTVLTIGNFDGVHRGHQALLHELRAVAAEFDAAPVAGRAQTGILTFDPHPLAVLRPELPLKLLTTPHERLQLASELGIDIGVIQPFTREFAALEPRSFLTLLQQRLGLAALVVGPDFALGRGRSGSLEVLAELAGELDYQLVVLEPVAWHDKSVRSRVIRQLLLDGDVEEAAQLLGRPYHVAGNVQVGDRLGSRIGIPTANLGVAETKLLPGDGVYATRAWVIQDGSAGLAAQSYAGVTNIGVRPTVNGATRRVETHLLDFTPAGATADLYGQDLVIEFVARLRGEKKFAGIEPLVAQIRTDIATARPLLDAAPLAALPFFLTALG